MDLQSALAWLMGPEGIEDPYPAYQALHEHGPVVQVTDSMFVVVGYDAANQILRDPSISVVNEARLDRDWPAWRTNRAATLLTETVLLTDPPDHGRVRPLLAGWFSARRVADLRGFVREQSDRLADGVAGRCADDGVADLVKDFALPLPVWIMCHILGVPPSDHRWFEERAGDLLIVMEASPQPEELERGNRTTREIEAYMTDLVAARRRRPADDLPSALIAAHDRDRTALTAQEILSHLVLLMAAALDSTAYLLANGLLHLLRHPEHAARLRADDGFAQPYVEELLRWDAPSQFTVRRATSTMQVAGTTLPPDAEILILLGAVNRDPRRFDSPQEFRPDRPGNHSLSFSAGPHFCFGAPLARLEAQIALPAVLRRLPDLTLAGEPTRLNRRAIRWYGRVPATVPATATQTTTGAVPQTVSVA
ncbi:cytochrome P450 [Microbispora cellulosiformans]|uniref:Cytochrome P450 n=1 Tax=Microbispora cellulosiformans TaxID=2614688 RepID=A0A5J5K0R0_9ACTN|nr:cytochrome P450 [Microbispora cellulosiformans]KAA9377577.1 cytochrome P450 [Microbispora cellulosiformans]